MHRKGFLILFNPRARELLIVPWSKNTCHTLSFSSWTC